MLADDYEGKFLALSKGLLNELGQGERELVAKIANLEPARTGCRGFEDLGAPVVDRLREASAIADLRTRATVSRALISHLASSALERIKSAAVTDEVVQRSELWLPRLFSYLEKPNDDDYWFPNDLFLKDYRFATGLTVPCGAQVVDLADGIGPKTAIKLGLRYPHMLVRALRRPWFQIHTESRYLDEFNDPGWRAFYKVAVNLLQLNPHIEGIVGTSWFYDPALSVVSPRLSYLRDYPLEHGAYSVKQGTTLFDIKSATATSETRRKLYEEGRYKPTCHTIVWPREAMISWANQYAA